jgi:hypothetical protein
MGLPLQRQTYAPPAQNSPQHMLVPGILRNAGGCAELRAAPTRAVNYAQARRCREFSAKRKMP